MYSIDKILESIRERHPLVHCLTNYVVKNYTANVLLAVGAAPAMVEHPEEAAQFASIADGVLVNVGTLTEELMVAARKAVISANKAKKPWVLDPVAVGGLTVRTEFSRELLEYKPAIIRGNASEIIGLSGETGKGRGVDSGDDALNALSAAKSLAKKTGGSVLVTGETDYITDGTKVVTCKNGNQLMTRVTGVGCSQGALAVACAAVTNSTLDATVATAAIMAVAGDMAAEKETRPGSYQIALLDALDEITPEILLKRAKVE
jgi:hydroxyethylthiazole kinase